MNTEKRTSNKSLRAAAALFCLVLVSTWFMNGVMAKYLVVNSYEEQSRIASFDVGVDENLTKELDVSLTPQNTNPEKYTLKIENSSEVAFRVKATLYIRGNLPLEIIVKNPSEKNKVVGKIENTLDTNLEADPVKLCWNLEIEANAENPFEENIFIGWTNVEGYDLAKYENGVESVKLVLDTEQID
jgi:hypothetical protein